jgi:RNA polymerase sigma-70 factor (ECF subfamily)
VQRLRFEAVYDGNVDFVWRVISRLGVPPPAVPDVAHEVFVVAHGKLGELQGRSIQPWLLQIARLAVHDYRRTLGHWDPPRSEEGVRLVDADPPPTDGNAPRAAVASSQAALLLHGILAEMGDQEREVFVLAELEQLPIPDIAEAIGVHPTTAHSRLELAREAFNRSIARHQGAIDDDDSLSLANEVF